MKYKKCVLHRQADIHIRVDRNNKDDINRKKNKKKNKKTATLIIKCKNTIKNSHVKFYDVIYA